METVETIDAPASGQGADRESGLLARLFSPVDIASLVAFRIVFGAIMVWEVWRYFKKGWISDAYIEP